MRHICSLDKPLEQKLAELRLSWKASDPKIRKSIEEQATQLKQQKLLSRHGTTR
jgi:hypothetical protein